MPNPASDLVRAIPSVTAVVVTYNSELVIGPCLDVLRRQVERVIVVDNASKDRTERIALQSGAEFLSMHCNAGYGRANNRGVAVSRSEWCLIVNPDVLLNEGCVNQLLQAARLYPKALLLVPRLVEPDGRIFFREKSELSEIFPILPEGHIRPVPHGKIAFASGACMLVRREAFQSLGGFDEDIFLYYEDDDLSLRARRAGYDVVFVDDAHARHIRGGSTRAEQGTVFRSRYHQAWSRAYVRTKYGLPSRAIRPVLVNLLKLTTAALSMNRERIERYGGSIAGGIASLRLRKGAAK